MKNIIKYVDEDKDLLGKVIVLKNDKILYIFDKYKDAFKVAKNRNDLRIFKIPKNLYSTRILPLKIRSFKKHPWIPLYPVKFFTKDGYIIEDSLIDSGADISVINYSFGLEIGLQEEEHDYIFQVEGLGGVMDYILKNIQIEINGIALQAPVAWLQDKSNTEEVIIGREIIFDMFDIEFKQKDEEIIFKLRK